MPDDVEKLFGLTSTGDDTFEALPVKFVPGDAFGGEALARALWAMTKSVEPARLPHSLHCYYLRPAQNGENTSFRVERERDGRNFSNRRATATQRGKHVLAAVASFHLASEVDPTEPFQQLVMPEVPDPESLPPGSATHMVLDARAVQPAGDRAVRIWSRATRPLPDDPALHLCLLAYLSDYQSGLSGTSLTGDSVISLDHVVWFHRRARMDDWVLMALEPVAVAMGRGTYRGTIFDRAGTILATFAQEMFGMPRNHPVYERPTG
jgi:acyl-CoA thioesterase-2